MAARFLPRAVARFLFSFFAIFALTLCLLGSSASADGAGARTPRWQAPVAGEVTVLRDFDKPAQKWSAGHRGVDLALGQSFQVRSPAAGRVVFSGQVVDRKVLTVEHADGRKSSFEPVTEALPAGTEVAAGQVIAQVDDEVPHCEPEPCLHWGVREGPDDYVNPLLFLGLADPSVLLPIGEDFGA